MVLGGNVHRPGYTALGKHDARIAGEMRHGIAQNAILADPAWTYNQNQSSRHSTRIPSLRRLICPKSTRSVNSITPRSESAPATLQTFPPPAPR